MDLFDPASAAVAIWVLTLTAVAPLFEGVLDAEVARPAPRLLLLLAVSAAYALVYLVVEIGNAAMVASIAARLDGAPTVYLC